MTIYSTIPDQAVVLPKKGTNFKGRLVSYATLAFALGAIVATSGATTGASATSIQQPSLASEPAPAANEKPAPRPVWFSVSMRAVAAMAFRPSARRSLRTGSFK